jgi:hypothetical protein
VLPLLAFARVPEMLVAPVTVWPLLGAVRTGVETLTAGSQLPPCWPDTLFDPAVETMGKKTDMPPGVEQLLPNELPESMPTAFWPMTAPPPLSPGRRHVVATMLLTGVPLTCTLVSTAWTVPQVHPVVLPDLQRVAPTMAGVSPVIVRGADASGAPVPPPQVAMLGCGRMPAASSPTIP